MGGQCIWLVVNWLAGWLVGWWSVANGWLVSG